MSKKIIYAEISSDGVTVCDTHIPLPPEVFCGDFDFGDASTVAALSLPKIKTNSLVLVANTRKTAVRVADITAEGTLTLSQDTQWRFVQKNFPIGDKMNEFTHTFDGSVFTNEAAKRVAQSSFFMVALPIAVSDIITKIGVALTGSIHNVARLDTAEHILFRKYSALHESAFILLPQEGGLRVLRIEENLPVVAHYISNDPEHREGEFMRFFGIIKSPPKVAIFVNCENDFAWLREILSSEIIDVPIRRLI